MVSMYRYQLGSFLWPIGGDVVQKSVLGAWLSMKAGGYRPSPDVPPVDALRAWLSGVAFLQASHSRDRAYRRRELPALDPEVLAHFITPSPGGWARWSTDRGTIRSQRARRFRRVVRAQAW